MCDYCRRLCLPDWMTGSCTLMRRYCLPNRLIVSSDCIIFTFCYRWTLERQQSIYPPHQLYNWRSNCCTVIIMSIRHEERWTVDRHLDQPLLDSSWDLPQWREPSHLLSPTTFRRSHHADEKQHWRLLAKWKSCLRVRVCECFFSGQLNEKVMSVGAICVQSTTKTTTDLNGADSDSFLRRCMCVERDDDTFAGCLFCISFAPEWHATNGVLAEKNAPPPLD